MRTRLTNSVLLILVTSFVAYGDEPGGVAREDSPSDRVPLQTIVPEYPPVARRDRIEGSVQVCFDISRNGYPRRIAVRRSSHRVFEKVAMKAIRRSTWQPLPEGQTPSGIKACRTFRFSLVPVTPDEQG